jgi:hypothetical protein
MSPATDWMESIARGESERHERFAEALCALQRRRAAGHKPDRALHAKPNLGARAEFEVLAELPEPARVGIFAEPGTYRGWVRYSNGAGAREADGKPGVRGVALKLVGVPGKKLIPGLEDEATQDFLLIKSPATPFRNADEFVGFVRAVEQPWRLPGYVVSIGLGRFLAIAAQLKKGLAEQVGSLAETRYFSALPIKLGAYAVHYALFPEASGPTERGASPDYLGEELSARLRQGPVRYDFRVQFYEDAQKTPIEDGSVEWKESDAPFVTLARLTLPQQDVGSEEGKKLAEKIEALSFDPWHAPVEFRPLGNMMRARNHAYRRSTQERGAAPEPKTDDLG